jgi:hypothetical protein
MRWSSKNQPRQVLAEPRRPALPQIASPDDVPPETSDETMTGPSLDDGYSVLRSRYWKQIHYCKLLCKRTCTDTVARTSGLSVSELREIGAKIGAKLDSIGFPGMSAELSSKESSTRTRSKETTQTTTFFTPTADCCGLTHARYRLVEKFTFEYTEAGFFGKRTKKAFPVETELNVFDETSIEYVMPGCCKDRDQDLAERQKDGYLVLMVARDGSLAAVVPAKPAGEGSYKLPGARGSFQVGDEIPRDIVTRWLGESEERRERWSNANPRLEPYAGSPGELGWADLTESDEDTSGSTLSNLMLGLCVGGALGLLYAGLRVKKGREKRRVQYEPLQQRSEEARSAPARDLQISEQRYTEAQEGTTYSSE